jgi:hypothetical protein
MGNSASQRETGETGRSDKSSARIDSLLRGAIDPHCHSGPSVMARKLDHIEATQDAAACGMRAILYKDHYYPSDSVALLINKHYAHLNVTAFSGIALNNSIGGFNTYAVEHSLSLGAKMVWMPTLSATNHLRHNYRRELLPTKFKLSKPIGLSCLSDRGEILDEVKRILDLIAEHDAVLSGGHMHVSEIFELFDEAKKRGVTRRIVNHPTYTIDATMADIKDLAEDGAYIEHSICMFVNCKSREYTNYTVDFLKTCIDAAGVERTILGSDMGQHYNPRPVDGMREIIGMCLELGYSDQEVRMLIGQNAAEMLGLEKAGNY